MSKMEKDDSHLRGFEFTDFLTAFEANYFNLNVPP